jgi:hypothetical protein
MPIKFFDLLGVSGAADPVGAAVALWPAIPPSSVGPAVDLRLVAQWVQDAFELRELRPGADPTTVGLYAKVHVTPRPGPGQPLVFPQLPDLSFHLQPTAETAPARVYATRTAAGTEWVIEALPVEIRLPPGMIEPLPETDGGIPDEEESPTDSYDLPTDEYDGLKVVLRHLDPSSIFVRINVRRTREGRFVLETAVPISLGKCKFLGIFPCRGLHGLGFIPSPTLGPGHSDRELALEWTRHTLDRAPSNVAYPGQVVVRTVDIDGSREPMRGLLAWMNGDRHDASMIELVLEDVALPLFTAIGTVPPLPTHGRIGIRRNTVTVSDPSSLDEYDLNADPVRIRIGSWFLLIEKLFFQTPAPPGWQPINVMMAMAEAGTRTHRLTGDTTEEARGPAFTFGVLDDWTIQLGIRAAGEHDPEGTGSAVTDVRIDEHGGIDHDTTTSTSTTTYTPPGLVLFSIPVASVAISALGVKVGLSIQRVADTSGAYGPEDTFLLLFDLGIFGTDGGSTTSNFGDSTPFRLSTSTGRPMSFVMRDIGWNLGELSLSGVSFPDGVEWRAFSVLRLIVNDLGWIAENNGGYYFFFSGGIGIDFSGGGGSSGSGSGGSGSGGSGSGGTSSSGTSTQSSGGGHFGLTFDRLRFKISGSASAPPFLLDGIAIDLEVGTFKLRGFGMYHDVEMRDAADRMFRLQEFGIGLQVGFNACAMDFLIGAQFFYGTIAYPPELADLNFKFWLAAAQFSPIPIGPYQLVNLRALVASNLDPHLEPNPEAPNMRLLKWYLDNEEALTLPEARQFGNIWDRVDRSLSLGVGAGLTFPGGKSVRIDLFVFFHKSPAEEGLLALIRLYLLGSRDPCAFGALELDLAHDKWAFMLGIDLNLNTILGTNSDALKFIKLVGTLYAGNKPTTFALGHLNDQDSWLSLLIRIDISVLVVKIQVGLCLELVDGGPNGFGFVVAVQAIVNLVILEIEGYLTLGVLIGSWRSESSAVGAMVWFEAGLRIRLLFIFTFGISARIQFDSLRSSPGYSKLSGDFHVDTPFFLPSINVHYEQIWSEPHPELISNVQPPLAAASAMAPGTQRMTDLPVTPLDPADLEDVPGGGRRRIKDTTIYNIEQLRAAGTPDYAGQPDAAAVGVDSTIALEFKPSLDDLLAMGINTPEGASAEPIEKYGTELTLTYELVSMSIQRRRRFGAGAGGAWLPLITPSETELFDPRHPDVPNPSAVYTPLVTYHWDGDLTAGGRTDPRRLLLNSETPFTLVTRSDETDEEHVRTEPGWPCHPGGPARALVVHVLAFDATPVGTRAPANPLFSLSRSRLAWGAARPPIVGGARWLTTPRRVARAPLPADALLAAITFDEPVMTLEAVMGWAQGSKGSVKLIAYRGVAKIAEVVLSLSTTPSPVVALNAAGGMTSAEVRIAATSGPGIELLELRYVGLRAEQTRGARAQRDAARSGQILGGDGKLAWLANHEYEVAVTVRVASAMERTATAPQVVLVEQRTRFVTKGLIGLNAVARAGDEVEPYVESRSPGPGLLVYRTEPIALAFTPGMNIVAPLDRAPAPGDPEERGQLLAWALTADETSGAGAVRVSQTGADWIAAHRTVPLQLSIGAILDPSIFMQRWRHAPSLDPLQRRFDQLIQSPGGCAAGTAPRLHRSQVLEHQPRDPRDGSARWRAGATFLASVRRDGGPCVDRAAFEPADDTAFAWASEGGAAAAWTLDGAALVAPAGSGAVRRYALFGELDWNHVVARATVVPAPSGQAGLAVAVDGTGLGQALIAVLVDSGVEEVPPRLHLFARSGGATTELAPDGGTTGGVPLAAVAARYELEITGYDDRVRVRSGETRVEVTRGALRDGKLALVATAGARFVSLAVRPLDAYTFPFTASRFDTFEDHIASFTGEPAVIAADGPAGATALATVAATFTPARIAEVAQLASPDADADARQAWFDACVRDLALPLHAKLSRIELTRLTRAGDTELFLLESPEPLPLGFDVRCELTDGIGRPVLLAILPDGPRTRALLVPIDADGPAAIPEDHYTLTFSIDRERYRGELPEARYQATASISFGVRALIHISRTVSGNWSRLAPPITAHDAVLLATPLWNPGGAGGVYCNHPLGVWDTGNGWAVFNQDGAAMPVNAAFNLAEVSADGVVHRATTANTGGNVTILDLPAANGHPNAIVLATPSWNPPGSPGVYLNRRIGVYYTGSRWAVFIQDIAAMPIGAAFNTFVARLDAFVHKTQSANIAGNTTTIDAVGVNGRPDAVLIVTPNWNPPGRPGVYHDHHIGVYYIGNRWAIFNEDLSSMPAGVSFNVWIAGYAAVPPPSLIRPVPPPRIPLRRPVPRRSPR